MIKDKNFTYELLLTRYLQNDLQFCVCFKDRLHFDIFVKIPIEL